MDRMVESVEIIRKLSGITLGEEQAALLVRALSAIVHHARTRRMRPRDIRLAWQLGCEQLEDRTFAERIEAQLDGRPEWDFELPEALR